MAASTLERNEWFGSIADDIAVKFFRKWRDRILKEAPIPMNQVVGRPTRRAAELYCFEGPSVPATDKVRTHLDQLEAIIRAGETRFQRRA
jgi:hypothetical protein